MESLQSQIASLESSQRQLEGEKLSLEIKIAEQEEQKEGTDLCGNCVGHREAYTVCLLSLPPLPPFHIAVLFSVPLNCLVGVS